jgi:predicted nuclease of predicted toxin-antitoxin system
MRIKLDENLPNELSALFASKGHDVHTVRDESLVGRDDQTVFQSAQGEERALITQDLDFSDARKFKPGTHYGVVLVRLHNPSRRRLIERFRQILDAERIEDWARCFVVISDKKLRVKRSMP